MTWSSIFSESEAAMNLLLQAIEKEGKLYGMNIHRSTCEFIYFGDILRDILFSGGAKPKKKHEATYLGCRINDRGDATKEILRRIAKCQVTLRRLDTCWHKSNCSTRHNILVYDMIIRANLTYGIGTLPLTQASRKKLEVEQVKGLRKILGMTTTWGGKKTRSRNDQL